MPKLHIKQLTVGKNRYRVELSLQEEGLAPMAVTAKFKFQLSEQDQKDLRWYLEDYLKFPFEPNPQIAARVEQRMTAIGTELFQAVFHADDDARDLWAELRRHLNKTRVEISVEDVQEATSIPWELLRDPKTDMPLALQSQVFVRMPSNPSLRAQLPSMASQDEPIRILLVICRPGEKFDVPFRSVASRLVKGLSEAEQAFFQLEVLRPSTFGQLSQVLRAARDAGKPFHVVHFDGHGSYLGIDDRVLTSSVTYGPNELLLSPRRDDHKHGYLVFENPAVNENQQLVDGPALGQLLVETQVPVLVLNACRSAHAEVSSETDDDAGGDGHAKVRAFGSLAQEVVDAGVAGVVAMRYNVYVVTAREFVEQLYAALINGYSFGEAVSLGRKHLRANPLREVVTQPLPLQDWLVPVVYEAAEIQLFPPPAPKQGLRIVLDNKPAIDDTLANLPARPDVGFIGRDETLLALDRAFDRDKLVLLHAYAGSGKTTTAVEFARWYHKTGGIEEGPVLFSKFETYKPLAQVLGDFGQVFAAMLEQAGINWSALVDLAQRRRVALQVLEQIPVLWIWDNVEPVTGFPAGCESAWDVDEQRELVDFLRAAQETQAKFLLTSRRDESAWLGNLPTRVKIPPMPHTERAQFAKALAEKYNQGVRNMGIWKPLLDFSRGNPLTITVLVGQALRDGLTSKEQILAFVEKLQAGEKAFADEESEGRSQSLGASLSYGFDNAFSEVERKQLAVLHFFQGFVAVNLLQTMGNPKADWSLPELHDLTRESGIKLLNRAAEIGLLTEHGAGYYSIHPALPWYFKQLFDSSFEKTQAATRAFVEAMGELGNYYIEQYENGNRDVIGLLTAEEANLLYARRLAKTYGWWLALLKTMQGLRVLYDRTGRRAEWASLVAEIVPYFVDSATDKPLAGREQWGLVTQYRVRLAMENRQWAEAERLQKVCVEWDRQNAAPFLDNPSAGEGHNVIRTLAASLHELGEIQRECQQTDCVKAYQESLNLSEQIGEQALAATCAFNLGRTYGGVSIPNFRNLEQATHWYQRSLELRSENDQQGRGGCLAQLGLVAYQRFEEARTANQSEDRLLQHINEAIQYYQDALKLSPDNAVNDLAVVHNALGVIYKNVGDLEQALFHYREAIGYDEMAGNLYGTGETRFNVAIALQDANRLPDALEYARAALRNFQSYPQGTEEMIQITEELIKEIEQALTD